MTHFVRTGLLTAVMLVVAITTWRTVGKSAGSGRQEEARIPPAGPLRQKSAIRVPNDQDSRMDIAIPDERIHEYLKLAGHDTPGTLAKVLALENKQERDEILEWILTAWTTEDRAPALAWLREVLPPIDENIFPGVIDLLIGDWAREAPLESVGWVRENLSNPWLEKSLRTIAARWAESEPQAMENWLLSQQSPPDFWAEELIHGLIPIDPVRAIKWCERISDAGVAEDSRQSVIQSWLLQTPEEALAWLKANPNVTPVLLPEVPPPP